MAKFIQYHKNKTLDEAVTDYFSILDEEISYFYGRVIIEKVSEEKVAFPKYTSKGFTAEGGGLIVCHHYLEDSDSFTEIFCPFTKTLKKFEIRKDNILIFPVFWGVLIRHTNTKCTEKKYNKISFNFKVVPPS
jgi:hypothetical protein